MPYSIRFPLAILCVFLLIETAHACGGFFCTNVPMNQAAERILFVKRTDGKITTHVQIQYSGEKTDFAWVLPVPSPPELSVSHNWIFTQLQFATQPTFLLDWQPGNCDPILPPIYRFDDVLEAAAGGEVTVVSEERVGPYETAVITADDPEAITKWLIDNNYQLDALGADLLKPYTDGGFYFLALRLAPKSDVGDLQPIAMTYDADKPGIPIQLTAVAAEPDMGVLTWVLGQTRAIPENYLHIKINEARIDWLSGGLNYDAVVTEAANEAGGQAFTTDYAGKSSIMQDRFLLPGQYDNLDALAAQTDPARFLEDLLRLGFPRDAQMQTLIRRHIPMPQRALEEGVLQIVYNGNREAYELARQDGTLQQIAERSFYNNMRAYAEYLTDFTFDPAAFIIDLRTIIVEPLENAQQLFAEHPYLTRLYTTLSADEMTIDPMFAFNPDLPAVDNVHRAKAQYECPPDVDPTPENVTVLITLADGREIRVKPRFFGIPGPIPEPVNPEFVDAAFSPLAASRIERMALFGTPTLIRGITLATPDFDNSGKIDFDDFLAFVNAFGKRDPAFDLTGDGKTDFRDFLTFANAFIAENN